jgi:hypothetical protein
MFHLHLHRLPIVSCNNNDKSCKILSSKLSSSPKKPTVPRGGSSSCPNLKHYYKRANQICTKDCNPPLEKANVVRESLRHHGSKKTLSDNRLLPSPSAVPLPTPKHSRAPEKLELQRIVFFSRCPKTHPCTKTRNPSIPKLTFSGAQKFAETGVHLNSSCETRMPSIPLALPLWSRRLSATVCLVSLTYSYRPPYSFQCFSYEVFFLAKSGYKSYMKCKTLTILLYSWLHTEKQI